MIYQGFIKGIKLSTKRDLQGVFSKDFLHFKKARGTAKAEDLC